MEPLISVVIPVYNTGDYLIACLDSILANSYRNFEIICINDGSTDNSLDILEHYAKLDKRIKIISQKNSGVSSARNTGISMSCGQYIAFIDSDDIIHPQYFEILLNGIRKYKAEAIFCEYNVINNSETEFNAIENPHYQRQNLNEILSDAKLRSTSIGRLYASEAIKDIRFPDLNVGEDCIFNCSVMCDLVHNKNKVVVKANHPLYYYVQRSSSISHSSEIVDKLPFCRQFLKFAIDEKDSDLKKTYTVLGIKYLLTARYEATIAWKNSKIKNSFNHELRKAIYLVNRNRGYGLKERIAYNMFYLFPETYRCFRILRNPSLRLWEKETYQKFQQKRGAL